MSAGREIMNTVMQAATQQARNYAPDVCFGDVTSVDPLKVKLENGLELTEDFLVVSCLCKETVIKIPKSKDDEFEHVHEIDAETEKATTGITAATTATIGIGPTVGVITITDSGHTHKIKVKTEKALPDIMLWRGLQKDDKVILIKFPPHKFLVLQRVEGITNDPEQ